MQRQSFWERLRHRHWKALDNNISIEGLKHVFRCQRVVNSSVFVLVETFQFLLTNVNHLDLRIMH